MRACSCGRWPDANYCRCDLNHIQSCTSHVSQAMELEFAFFDAQIQGSTADDRPKQSPSADTAGPQSSSVQSGGEDARDRGRFRGVHESVSLLCVDFDDTLTDGDTTSLLVETAKAQVRFGCRPCGVYPYMGCALHHSFIVWRQF